jgi:serine/threonine protein kinase/tetratricopeptide (TPR) repeat protein
MTDEAERFREADRLLEAALDLPVADRAAFLDRECDGDVSLRALLERLLASAEQDSEWPVPDPLPGDSTPPSAPPETPEPVGPYTLRERIGSGGFGDVWLADQTQPVRRRVALKILKAGMDTKSVLARFEAESQALAMMDHPNIAKVFDAGQTERGRPYFVMEYVPGVPITEYCDRNRLTTRERLGLFRAVCEAVHHAHGRGIIHRDLKPSNILVGLADGSPAPKVIDFGIAKATTATLTDLTLHTVHGQVMGTPAYMSPEQVGGELDVDTRTDVYSLGVILYELLTGTRPFEPETAGRSGWESLQRMIRESDPVKPSTRLSASPEAAVGAAGRRRTEPMVLRRELRGELDWITMKALEKDRTRRYETASAMSRDVKRFLDGDPVEAGPPGTGYRFRKFAQRHKLVLGAATAVIVGVMVAAGALAWALVDSNRQRARVEAALEETEQERAAAEAVTRFVTDMLASADPSHEGRDVTVLEVLDDASAAVSQELGDRPALEARVREALGSTYHGLGEFDASAAELRRAVALNEQRLGPDHRVTLETRRQLGTTLRDLADYSSAEQVLRDVLRREEAALGAGDSAVAFTLDQLGTVLTLEGRYHDADPVQSRADSLARAIFGPDDPRTAKIAGNYGVLCRLLGRYDESRRVLTDVLRVLTREWGAENPNTMNTMANLANVHYHLGEYDEAAATMQSLAETKVRVLGAEHASTLQAWNDLAVTWNGMGRYAEAESLGLRILADRRRTQGDDAPGTLQSLNNVAGVYMRTERYARAEPLYREAYETARRVMGPDHLQTIIMQGNLGYVLRLQGRTAEAEELLRRAIGASERELPPDHANRNDVLRKWAECLIDLGRREEAEAALLAAYGRLEEKLGADHLYARRAVAALVRLYEGWERPEDAAEWRGKPGGDE